MSSLWRCTKQMHTNACYEKLKRSRKYPNRQSTGQKKFKLPIMCYYCFSLAPCRKCDNHYDTSTCGFFLCTSKWLFYMCLKITVKHHQSEKNSVPYCLNLFETTLDTFVCTLASWFCCYSVRVVFSKM